MIRLARRHSSNQAELHQKIYANPVHVLLGPDHLVPNIALRAITRLSPPTPTSILDKILERHNLAAEEANERLNNLIGLN